jgi:hypothetical protein
VLLLVVHIEIIWNNKKLSGIAYGYSRDYNFIATCNEYDIRICEREIDAWIKLA